jgi:uroporphyrinogen decarboxylase
VNHRERVRAAIHHQQPDRVPVDLGGMRSSTIMAVAYARIKEYLYITQGDIYVFDPLLQLAYVEEPIRQFLGNDAVFLYDLEREWHNYALPDGTPAKIPSHFRTEPDGQGGEYHLDGAGRRTWHRPASSHYFDPIYWPLAEATSMADLDRYDWPPPPSDEYLSHLQSVAKRLYTETEYAIIGEWEAGSLLEGGQWLRGQANFLMDLAGDRAFAEALLDRILEHQLRATDLYLDAVDDYIQIIQVNDDLGMQTGPQIGPQMYYDIIQPRQKVIWDRVHKLSPNVAVFLHSCGGIYDLIPGLIDAGCDVLNPVQIGARGMDPERLKREFGDKLCFWGGGCDTQQVLPFGAPEEVYEHTRRNVEILKPGGGFVFCQVHNIQAGVPPENIVAMFRAVHDAWTY